jgi:hypothetical protein
LHVYCHGNVFPESLPSNDHLFWLHYSSFQASCHNIIVNTGIECSDKSEDTVHTCCQYNHSALDTAAEEIDSLADSTDERSEGSSVLGVSGLEWNQNCFQERYGNMFVQFTLSDCTGLSSCLCFLPAVITKYISTIQQLRTGQGLSIIVRTISDRNRGNCLMRKCLVYTLFPLLEVQRREQKTICEDINISRQCVDLWKRWKGNQRETHIQECLFWILAGILAVLRFCAIFISSGKCWDSTWVQWWLLPSKSFSIHQLTYHLIPYSLVKWQHHKMTHLIIKEYEVEMNVDKMLTARILSNLDINIKIKAKDTVIQ